DLGPINVLSSSVPQRGGYARIVEPVKELLGDLWLRGRPNGPGRGVEWDGVNARPAADAGINLFRQQLSTPSVVVHVFDHCVLNGQRATGIDKVIIVGVKGLVSDPTGIDRDHLIAQFIIGSVQGKCKGYRDAFSSKFIDGRH